MTTGCFVVVIQCIGSATCSYRSLPATTPSSSVESAGPQSRGEAVLPNVQGGSLRMCQAYFCTAGVACSLVLFVVFFALQVFDRQLPALALVRSPCNLQEGSPPSLSPLCASQLTPLSPSGGGSMTNDPFVTTRCQADTVSRRRDWTHLTLMIRYRFFFKSNKVSNTFSSYIMLIS